jgi:Zn-finger nucleic acid-binding protein
MVEKDFGNGVKVDVCANGCKGIWFDWFELRKLDEKNEGCGYALQDALKEPRTNDENRAQILCPKCNASMHIHKYKSAREVNVDECYHCGGFFLDSGELHEIRENFMDEKESALYCQSLVNNIPNFIKAELTLEQQKARTEAFQKYTKFLRLSYFLKGK